MTSLKNIVFGCVSDHGSESSIKQSKAPLDKPPPLQRVKFGLPLTDAFKDNVIPVQLMDMLIYIARDGVTTTDLFRRPGNPTDMKNILKKMADGRDVEYSNYNFYTLASVIKKFLLKIPGGIFGSEAENQLLQVLNINEKLLQFDAINKIYNLQYKLVPNIDTHMKFRIIKSLPPCTQHMMSLLFGTWFRMSHHSDHNSMSSESVAKSVAGSLFHTCADDPNMVNLASDVVKILVENFASTAVFGRENVEYFARVTKTRIAVKEKFKYELDPLSFGGGGGGCGSNGGHGGSGGTGGGGSKNLQHIPSIEECLSLFDKVVLHDVKLRGIDPNANAITPNEFSSHDYSYAWSNMLPPSNRLSMASSLPTPHAPRSNHHINPPTLQPSIDQQSMASYLSAPDVCEANDEDNNTILTKSLSRAESVYKRQMLRLRLRNNWFLDKSTTTTRSTSVHSQLMRSQYSQQTDNINTNVSTNLFSSYHQPQYSSTSNKCYPQQLMDISTTTSLPVSFMTSSFSCDVLSPSDVKVSERTTQVQPQQTRLAVRTSESSSSTFVTCSATPSTTSTTPCPSPNLREKISPLKTYNLQQEAQQMLKNPTLLTTSTAQPSQHSPEKAFSQMKTSDYSSMFCSLAQSKLLLTTSPETKSSSTTSNIASSIDPKDNIITWGGADDSSILSSTSPPQPHSFSYLSTTGSYFQKSGTKQPQQPQQQQQQLNEQQPQQKMIIPSLTFTEEPTATTAMTTATNPPRTIRCFQVEHLYGINDDKSSGITSDRNVVINVKSGDSDITTGGRGDGRDDDRDDVKQDQNVHKAT